MTSLGPTSHPWLHGLFCHLVPEASSMACAASSDLTRGIRPQRVTPNQPPSSLWACWQPPLRSPPLTPPLHSSTPRPSPPHPLADHPHPSLITPTMCHVPGVSCASFYPRFHASFVRSAMRSCASGLRSPPGLCPISICSPSGSVRSLSSLRPVRPCAVHPDVRHVQCFIEGSDSDPCVPYEDPGIPC